MRVIVLRPGIPGQELVSRLQVIGFSAEHCPLIDFQSVAPTAKDQALLHNLSNYTIIVALSPRAAEFIQPWLPDKPKPWPTQVAYYAVGQASAQAFRQQCGQSVQYPAGHSSSESLLALSRFAQVTGDMILLLRGQGGRRHLADQLVKRGAKVSTCRCYRRISIKNYRLEQRDFWQQSAVNCLVVTSSELLRRLCIVVPSSIHSQLFGCLMVVVSKRLAKIAYQLGWRWITVADNADNDALVRMIRSEANILTL